ncbi:AraC family transcriptional regulator [Sphingomonas sp.]|uniref:helix-turn-helix transcriptional regulator n=1 Tax=Sphingomonas sp. TaxID=28214 RepID=UPI0031D7D05E
MIETAPLKGAFCASDIVREAAALALVEPIAQDEDAPAISPQFEGWMRFDQVHPGLAMSVHDLTPLVDTTITQPVRRSVTLGIVLDGEGGVFQIGGHAPLRSAPQCAHFVGIGEDQSGHRIFYKGDRCLRVGLTLDPSFLEGSADALPHPDLAMIERLMRPGLHNYSLPRSELLIHMAHATMSSRYCGSLGRLFRESAALQLMFESLRLLNDDAHKIAQVGHRVYDAVVAARGLINASLMSPPHTIELAKQVGLNVNALQKAFKAIEGRTIFAYHRHRRLDVARVLIIEHGFGMAEAGYRVGFTSPSAFSAAYKKEFGITPTASARIVDGCNAH